MTAGRHAGYRNTESIGQASCRAPSVGTS